MNDIDHRARRAFVWTHVWWTFVGVLIMAMLASNLWIGLSIHGEQRANAQRDADTHSASVQSRAVLLVLRDCLQPGGKCYARSQASTQRVLTQAEVVFLAVQTCARTYRGYAALATCTNRLIEEHTP